MAERKTAAKTEEVKTPEVKAEEKKTAPKKTTAKKTAAKTTAKTAVKKAAAEKVAAAEKKVSVRKSAASKKEAVKETVCLEFSGKSYTPDDLLKSCRDVWKYDLNGKEEDIKSMELYVKPEESTTYYVINGEIKGSFSI